MEFCCCFHALVVIAEDEASFWATTCLDGRLCWCFPALAVEVRCFWRSRPLISAPPSLAIFRCLLWGIYVVLDYLCAHPLS